MKTAHKQYLNTEKEEAVLWESYLDLYSTDTLNLLPDPNLFDHFWQNYEQLLQKVRLHYVPKTTAYKKMPGRQLNKIDEGIRQIFYSHWDKPCTLGYRKTELRFTETAVTFTKGNKTTRVTYNILSTVWHNAQGLLVSGEQGQNTFKIIIPHGIDNLDKIKAFFNEVRLYNYRQQHNFYYNPQASYNKTIQTVSVPQKTVPKKAVPVSKPKATVPVVKNQSDIETIFYKYWDKPFTLNHKGVVLNFTPGAVTCTKNKKNETLPYAILNTVWRNAQGLLVSGEQGQATLEIRIPHAVDNLTKIKGFFDEIATCNYRRKTKK